MENQSDALFGPSHFEEKIAVILDGGLATELERNGYDLDHPLWSARLVIEDPDAVRKVHLSFLEAGADLITTASYQMSFPGCIKLGISEEETERLLRKTVEIATDARESYLESATPATDSFPLVAASVGPYGAYLANGAEYTGDYGVSRDELYEFHTRRFEVLAATDADLMACETIPSFEEAEVLLDLIDKNTAKPAILSFSCRDEEHIADGTPIAECAKILANSNQLLAIGINCTAPGRVSSLIKKVRKAAPGKEVAVYPNSGETYDALNRTWQGTSTADDFAKLSQQWFRDGARLIGGCCRTGPGHIKAIRDALKVTT